MPWTIDDLANLPDDGRRYEIFDGELVVTPRPLPLHQMSIAALYRLLLAACPPDMEVLIGPIDFQPTRTRSFAPDLLVARRAPVRPMAALTDPPLLTVEVSNESTRAIDRMCKPALYATCAVDNYWIFDPHALEFVALTRNGERYVEVAEATGNERVLVEEPCRIEICPAVIAAG